MFKRFEDGGYPRTTLYRAMNIADNTLQEHLLGESEGNNIRDTVGQNI